MKNFISQTLPLQKEIETTKILKKSLYYAKKYRENMKSFQKELYE